MFISICSLYPEDWDSTHTPGLQHIYCIGHPLDIYINQNCHFFCPRLLEFFLRVKIFRQPFFHIQNIREGSFCIFPVFLFICRFQPFLPFYYNMHFLEYNLLFRQNRLIIDTALTPSRHKRTKTICLRRFCPFIVASNVFIIRQNTNRPQNRLICLILLWYLSYHVQINILHTNQYIRNTIWPTYKSGGT